MHVIGGKIIEKADQDKCDVAGEGKYLELLRKSITGALMPEWGKCPDYHTPCRLNETKPYDAKVGLCFSFFFVFHANAFQDAK